jgi:hypothetical protein
VTFVSVSPTNSIRLAIMIEQLLKRATDTGVEHDELGPEGGV